MTKDSISNKLSELFDLYKSGALTKDEYDLLKSELISDKESKQSDDVKISQIESSAIENDVGSSSKEESIPEPITKIEKENQIPEKKIEAGLENEKNENKQKKKTIKTPDKPIQVKKGNTIWIVSIIAIVSLVIAILMFRTSLFSDELDVADIQEQIVEDIDGNVYHTVTIGTQVWMVENLKTTKYNDGTPIPSVTDNSAWRTLTTPAYCWYNNNEIANKKTFGALYNWYAVNTNKLCPDGWHVPTDSEWTTLTDYLSKNGFGYQGSGDDIGKSLASTTGWNVATEIGSVGNTPSINNKSGFNAFPSGIRFSNGEFRHIGQNGKWWSSTETSANASQIRFINWDDCILTSYSNRKENGFSVRCVKDSGIPEDNISDNSN